MAMILDRDFCDRFVSTMRNDAKPPPLSKLRKSPDKVVSVDGTKPLATLLLDDQFKTGTDVLRLTNRVD